jgi:predicted dehydrogenase
LNQTESREDSLPHLNLAVAGAGLIGRRHIAMIMDSDRCNLSAIVDPSEAAAQQARELGVPLYPTIEALFAAAKPDGIVLATPNQLHVVHANQCIEAGVPAIIEKPVADTLESGIELVEIAERANAKLLVGHHRRYGSVIAKAVETIGSGALGKIVAVVGTALFYKAESEGYFDGAFSWRREPGGGPIMLNMIHEVSNLRALVGEIVEVQAMASSATRGFPVEDTAAITLRFENGALGTFLLSDTAATDRSWEHTSGEDKFRFAKAHTDDDDCYLVSGTWGTLAIPTMRLQRYIREEDRSWHKALEKTRLSLDVADPLAQQIDHFCDVIEGKAEPLVTVRDGLQNLRVVDAILKAITTGGVVSIAR